MTALSLPRFRARAATPWLRRGGGAVLVSAFVHAAMAMTIGGFVASRATGHDADTLEMELDVSPAPKTLPVAASPQAAPASAAPTRAPTAARARVAVAKASARAETRAAALAVPPTTDDETRPHFALSAGTIASGPALAAPSAAPSAEANGAEANGAAPAAVGERDVDVAARLLSASPLIYPPAAQKAELETDLSVEIVVDVTGRVVSAHAVTRAGFGLDEAAALAIRHYRFSPALRAGRPVAVRMRWTVQFRLR